MKVHPYRFLKYCTALLVLLLLVTNCERDTVFEKQEQSSFKNSIVTYNQLPINVLNAIGEVAPDSDMAKKSNIGILIDKDYIVKMVDTLENTAYSLKFYFKDTPENVIWNLVVQSDEEDNVQRPYVMKYTIDNIEDIKGDEGSLDFTKMKGTIGYYTYDRFLNILNTSKANRSITSMSSNEPCIPIDVNLPSDNFDDEDDSSGGGSAGGGGGSNNCTVIVWTVGDLAWVTVHCITYTQRSAYTAMANDCDPSGGGGGPTNGDQNTPINGGGDNETDCPSGNIVNGECVPTTGEDDCNTFDERIEDLFNTEGGFVNDPVDPGGATNKGISWIVWKQNAKSILGVDPTLENLKNLTESQAKLIYKAKYWNPIKADNIDDGDLRWLLFDFYVNAGSNAVKVLQKTVNQIGLNVSIDGVMGEQTLSAINSSENKILLYNLFKDNRQKYYNEITEISINRYKVKNPNANESELLLKTFKRFINGWTNRVNEFIDKTNQNFINVNC